MKKTAGFIRLAFLLFIVACSSVAPWQPTPINDFKSIAGMWEGRLTSDDPRKLGDDRATLVIDDTGVYGVYKANVTRTEIRDKELSVYYRQIELFPDQGKLVLTDGKLTAKFENGGDMTVQLYVDPASGLRMLKAEGKTSQGFLYSANLTPVNR